MQDRLGVFLDTATVTRNDLDWLTLQAAMPLWIFHDKTLVGQTAGRIRGATVVVSNKALISREDLLEAKSLRLICIAATGTNNVDLDAARERNIAVCNVPAYATPSVVQHVFSLLLALATNLHEYQKAVAAHRWEQSDQFCFLDYPITELAGKTLGIVGYGELGRAVVKIAKAFGMKVLIAVRPGGERTADRLPLSELLPQVDVLSLHCPLNEQTRGLIGRREFALMKPGAILINTARGGIVDEQALVEALKSQHLGGAGVDVLTTEPPVQGNPLLATDIPNLIVTPHIAWGAQQARQRLVNLVAANIQAFFAGKPQNQVA